MRGWKPLLRFGESTLIETVVTTALEVCRKVVLVVGYRGEDLAVVFNSNARVRIARNRDWEEGMLSSVQAGLRRIDTERFFIVPGDMPYLPGEVYRELMRAPRADAVAPEYEGMRGHPVLIDRGINGRILGAGRDRSSMREILDGEDLRVLPWKDDSVLRDIDTPEDYASGRSG